MKKVLLMAVLGTMSLTAFSRDFDEAYNLVSISYDNTTVTSNDWIFEDTKTLGTNGFGLEYVHGFGFSRLPMFIEVGGKLSFTFNNRSYEEGDRDYYDKWKYTTTVARLNVPVSYAYRFSFGEDMAVTPYAGFDFRFNLIGSTKSTIKSWEYGDRHEYTDSETLNWFDKDDVEDFFDVTNGSWKRFQIGWHIGARFQWKNYFAGLSYGTDITPLFDYNLIYEDRYGEYKEKVNWRTGNFALSLGYCF